MVRCTGIPVASQPLQYLLFSVFDFLFLLLCFFVFVFNNGHAFECEVVSYCSLDFLSLMIRDVEHLWRNILSLLPIFKSVYHHVVIEL